MAGRARSGRWVEEKAAPPVDLRLVPSAAAIWLGALLGLLSGPIAWWTAGLAMPAILGVAIRRVAWWRGWAVLLGCLAAGIVVTTLQIGQQANDCLLYTSDAAD